MQLLKTTWNKHDPFPLFIFFVYISVIYWSLHSWILAGLYPCETVHRTSAFDKRLNIVHNRPVILTFLLEWMGGGCGRVAHLESLDVLKESCHVIKFHFSLQNCNLLFKFVHPEVGEWSYVRTLQGAFVEGDWKWRNKLDSTVLLFYLVIRLNGKIWCQHLTIRKSWLYFPSGLLKWRLKRIIKRLWYLKTRAWTDNKIWNL